MYFSIIYFIYVNQNVIYAIDKQSLENTKDDAEHQLEILCHLLESIA